MISKHNLSVALLALSAALPMTLATSLAHAQPNETNARAMFPARIDAFNVVQVAHVRPGEELDFTLKGTPGALVTLQIVGSTRTIQMAEARPGHYEGSYTVGSRDRVTSASLVTARMLKDGQAVTAALDQSVVSGARSPAEGLVKIAAFDVSAPDRIRPGDELKFSMNGSPGGKARVAVVGVQDRIALTEVRGGVYEGAYTLRRQDRMDRNLSATGFLVVNGKESTQRFARESTVPGGDDRRDPPEQARAVPTCPNCGVIEAVNLVEAKGEGNNVVGTIAGGVVGGVLGHQVGGGSGKDLATIAGALGGAYAGNRVQNNMGKTMEYDVVVRLESGASQTVKFQNDPALKTGQRVKLENNTIVRL